MFAAVLAAGTAPSLHIHKYCYVVYIPTHKLHYIGVLDYLSNKNGAETSMALLYSDSFIKGPE